MPRNFSTSTRARNIAKSMRGKPAAEVLAAIKKIPGGETFLRKSVKHTGRNHGTSITTDGQLLRNITGAKSTGGPGSYGGHGSAKLSRTSFVDASEGDKPTEPPQEGDAQPSGDQTAPPPAAPGGIFTPRPLAG